MAKKRYVLVGTGARGLGMFAEPLAEGFADWAELVALCDVNPKRAAIVAQLLGTSLPVYTDFGPMMREVDPDGVIVTSKDVTHAQYVVAALKAGKRVFSEKPLCVSAAQCREILAAAKDSNGLCRVTHNARYVAAIEKVRDILRSGRLGEPVFMQFDEALDRCHGADYFRRWHREKQNSGTLLIHKASHHFDVLNWWAGSTPEWVSAQGALRFYGANGPFRHARCRDCPHAERCEFHSDVFAVERHRQLYLEAESGDGYMRDGCVFDAGIDIYDQMGVLIRYANGIQVSYTLTAYSPYESQRVVIEGTKGRLEYFTGYNTGWVVDSRPLPGVEEIANESLRLFIPGEGIEDVAVTRPSGGHGGADPRLRQDFFARAWDAEPNEQMASLDEAIQAVLLGVAAGDSIATGQPVRVQGLLEG